MRAAVLHRAGERLRIEERPQPVPGPGEILLRVGRCGICGSDLHMARDREVGEPEGFVFGHEYAGEVSAVGTGVDGISPGDRVAAMPLTGCGRCAACLAGRPAYCPERRLVQGGYAGYALARARECVLLPASVADADGALVEPLAVALHGCRLAGTIERRRVLILGAGPIGLLTALWARRLAAAAVAVSARSRRAEPLAHELGASGFVAADDLETDLSGVLDGPPDVIFECTGAPGLLDRSVELLARGGTVLVQGLASRPETFTARAAIGKEARLQFSAFFDLPDFAASRDLLAAGAPEAARLVTETISLDALPGRFAAMQRGGSVGKVLVDPWA